jgi:hypothetical protein
MKISLTAQELREHIDSLYLLAEELERYGGDAPRQLRLLATVYEDDLKRQEKIK